MLRTTYLSLFIFLLSAIVLSAATVSVTNLTDAVNGNVSSVADLIANDGGDGISYREAIRATNNTDEANTINVDVSGTVILMSNMDDILSEIITINGNGIILDGDGMYVFNSAQTRIATLNDITFFNGGVGEIFDYTGFGSNDGESFTMNNCIFDSNNSGNSQVFECDDPGCIFNNCIFRNNVGQYTLSMCEETIHVNDCIFVGNNNNRSTYEHDSGYGEFRGCLFDGNAADSSLVLQDASQDALLLIINSTFSDNTLSASGDALFDFSAGNRDHLELVNVTIADNNLSGGAAVFRVEGSDSLVIKNSLISNSGLPADYFNDEANGTIVSISNIFEGYVGTVPVKANVDPMLGPLADNGGPTMTHALLEGSPAIDMGDSGSCPELDQRDFFRDPSCDIGAYEFGARPFPIPTLSQWTVILLGLFISICGLLSIRKRKHTIISDWT